MIKYLVSKIYFKLRRIAYSSCSNNPNVEGVFKAYIPVVIRGKGKVFLGNKVNFGVINSPLFYNSYTYIESRNKEAIITFGNNININNSFSIIAEKGVEIKDNVIIGLNCCISDSNFHDLNPKKRHETDPDPQIVIINENVFIGNNVTILKGVEIGCNSVIAANTVVTKSFPKDVVIGGHPAKIISQLS